MLVAEQECVERHVALRRDNGDPLCVSGEQNQALQG